MRRSVVALVGALTAVLLRGAMHSGESIAAGTTRPTTDPTTASTEPATGRKVQIGLVTGQVDAATAQGMVHAAELAVRHANSDNRLPGWHLELTVVGASSPNTAAKRARKLDSQDDMAAIIGAADDNTATRIAATMKPTSVPVVLVGPTDPAITRGTDIAGPRRVNPMVFRLGPTTSAEGPAMADAIVDDLHAATAVVVSDGQPGSRATATQLVKRLTSRGVTVVAQEELPGSASASRLADRLTALNPPAVGFVGRAELGSDLLTFLQQATTAPIGFVVSRESCGSPTKPDASSPPVVDQRCISLNPPSGQLTTARAFFEDYRASRQPNSAGSYGAVSYDAVAVVVDALRRTLPAGKDTTVKRQRGQIASALASTVMTGTIGPIRFDLYGDLLNPPIAVMRYDGTVWKPSSVVRA